MTEHEHYYTVLIKTRWLRLPRLYCKCGHRPG
jgi:hypothetical protein